MEPSTVDINQDSSKERSIIKILYKKRKEENFWKEGRIKVDNIVYIYAIIILPGHNPSMWDG